MIAGSSFLVPDEAQVFTAPVGTPVPHGPPRYEVLHYPGDLSSRILPGQVLGTDEFGRPYEVLDTELEHVLVEGHYDGDGCTFPDAGHTHARTTVHLQYATPETLAAAFAQPAGGAR